MGINELVGNEDAISMCSVKCLFYILTSLFTQESGQLDPLFNQLVPLFETTRPPSKKIFP